MPSAKCPHERSVTLWFSSVGFTKSWMEASVGTAISVFVVIVPLPSNRRLCPFFRSGSLEVACTVAPTTASLYL